MEKHTKRTTDDKKDLISRLNRIEGQVRGISKMIEDDRYCGDILIQLSAIISSIKSLSLKILEKHLKHCVKNNILEGEECLEKADKYYELSIFEKNENSEIVNQYIYKYENEYYNKIYNCKNYSRHYFFIMVNRK